MSKTTPGPWRVANNPAQIMAGGTGRTSTIGKAWMMRNGEGKANARLMSKSPEMYELLKKLSVEGLPMSLKERSFVENLVSFVEEKTIEE